MIKYDKEEKRLEISEEEIVSFNDVCQYQDKAEIVLIKNCTKVNKRAFERFKRLNVARFINVEIIEDAAFAYCTNLYIVSFSCVKKIKRRAFAHCNIKKLAIPGIIKTIEREAFSDNPNLESIAIDAGVECIKERAFSSIPHLNDTKGIEVFISSTIKRIDKNAFFGQKINCLIMPKGERNHHKDAFAYSSIDTLKIIDTEEEYFIPNTEDIWLFLKK